ncbi:hypothetical protein VKT23_017709 [Stygiomarasmius scandens]|uniref:Uncharacterized protein n=1 Tax=Marasmiellus scandens TaxID=2682957 RepID=A0ABR1IU16_9AGAR
MAFSRNVAQMRHFAHTQNSVFDNTNMQFIAGNRFNHRNSPPSYAPGYNAHTSSGSQLRQPPQLSPGRPSLPNNHYTLPVDRHSTASTLSQGARPQKKFYVFIGPADWTTDSRTNLQKLRQIMQHFDDRSLVPKDPDTIEYIDQERRLLRLAFSSEGDADEFTTYFGEHVRQLPREYKKMRAHIQL